jgi:hypothetical protein
MILSSNRKKIAIITAYKPCKTTGPNTTWSQQWILLREKSENPDPTAALCNDLNETLRNWRSQNMEIILMIDENEEIGNKPGGFGQILAQNGLFDILANQHIAEKYPPTYARGSKRIDYIFATESIQTNCKSSGILPMHHGYPSDLRAVFIRIDLQKILSTEIHPLESISTR